MPVFTRPDAEIHYEVHGSGYPLLLFAPGGLRSELSYWRQSPSNPSAPPPWMNPMADLAGRFTVIGMDQRNAGSSRGAVTETHGWHTYAGDHLALMDHLGHRRFHVMGGCIGATFCLTLCELAARAGHRRGAAEPDRPAREPGHLGGGGQRLRQDHAGPRPHADRGRHPEVRPQHVRRRLRLLGQPRFRAPLLAPRSCCSRAPTSRIRPRPAPRSPDWPPTSRSRRTGAARRTSPSRSAGSPSS